MRIWTHRLDDEDRPPVWNNRDERDWPIIDDFEVVLEKIVGPIPEDWTEVVEGPEWDEEPDPGEEHYWVYFLSEKRGYIMVLSPWVEEDLCREDFTIPFNFIEIDQGGDLLITTHREFVYVSEGEYKKPENFVTPWLQVPWKNIPLGNFFKAFQFPRMHAWTSYKVPKDRYIAEWNLAIKAAGDLC